MRVVNCNYHTDSLFKWPYKTFSLDEGRGKRFTCTCSSLSPVSAARMATSDGCTVLLRLKCRSRAYSWSGAILGGASSSGDELGMYLFDMTTYSLQLYDKEKAVNDKQTTMRHSRSRAVQCPTFVPFTRLSAAFIRPSDESIALRVIRAELR